MNTVQLLLTGSVIGIVAFNVVLLIMIYDSYRKHLKDDVPLRKKPKAFLVVASGKIQHLDTHFATKVYIAFMIAFAILTWATYIFGVGLAVFY
ncbi:MAG: hypothetical protein ABEH81_00840 [Halopenitus sp.]